MPDDKALTIGSLNATFEDVRLPFGLVVRRASVRGANVDLSTHPVSVQLAEPATFGADVDEAAIEAFLTARAPGGLKGFKVRLADGHIHVEAVLKVLIEVKASAVCRLVIHERRQLVVELESADVLSVGAKTLIQSQIDNVNPIFDVAQLPVPATLEAVTVGDGVVHLTGTVSPPE